MMSLPRQRRHILLSAFVLFAPRPALAIPGLDTMAAAQMISMLAEQVTVLRELLSNAKATLSAASTSAQLARDSMRTVSDFEDYLEAPSGLFGFRAEDFSKRLAEVRAGALDPGPGGAKVAGSAKPLHDPFGPGPLHKASVTLGALHASALDNLHKHVAYTQQAGSKLVEQLQGIGISLPTAMRSSARSAVLAAAAAAESTLQLTRIDQRQQMQEVLQLEDKALQLADRAREVAGMGVAVGQEAKRGMQSFAYGRQRSLRDERR